MKLLRFFGNYLRGYVGWILVVAVTVPIYGLASASMVALIEPIFGEVLLADRGSAPMPVETAPDVASPTGFNAKQFADDLYQKTKALFGITPENVYWFTPLLLWFVFALRGLANFVSGYSFQRIGLGVTTDIRDDLYRKLLEQSSSFHAQHTSGELVSRSVNDVAQLQLAVTARLFDLIQQGVTLVLLLALLLSTHMQLALICILGTPLVVFTIARFGRGMRRASVRSQERMGEVTGLLAEGVRGHRVVKAFGMEEFEHQRFKQATKRHLRVNLWAQFLANLSSPVVESIVAMGTTAFLLYAGLKIRSGELTAPLLVQFMANLLLLYEPVRKLNKVNLILQQALAAGHRLADMIALDNEIHDRPGAIEISGVERDLSFENVCFGYDNVPVLVEATVRIAKGERIAVVGPSGAGKTTLINLLPRFFDPDSGRVAIDGRDIRDITLQSLRSQIGIVTQETTLFNDTVRNNIAYGRSDLELDAVRRAAEAAYADDFVQKLPKGYDTVIGEFGMQLSGGQRQRLAIARALLKDAPILILDEATSQLDSESEAVVQKAMQNLMLGRTTLVIAHRLSTVVESDRILVMEAGRIVETGTHRELLERGGTYKRLYDLQLREGASSVQSY